VERPGYIPLVSSLDLGLLKVEGQDKQLTMRQQEHMSPNNLVNTAVGTRLRISWLYVLSIPHSDGVWAYNSLWRLKVLRGEEAQNFFCIGRLAFSLVP
jgi:hypothetical protein